MWVSAFDHEDVCVFATTSKRVEIAARPRNSKLSSLMARVTLIAGMVRRVIRGRNDRNSGETFDESLLGGLARALRCCMHQKRPFQ